MASSNITEHCACHAKWLSWLILVTYETLFTMRGTTDSILQHHRTLRLPRKMTVMTDPRHIWNVIYNARNNRWHRPTSPNTAPATQIDSWNFHKNFSKTAETSFTMRDRSEQDPRMIRAGSENDPTMKPSVRNPPRNRGYFSRSPRAFSIEKYNISRSGYHSKFHRILRLPREVTVQHRQILRLPRKVAVMTDPCHIWNVIYNARSNKCHCPNSPNTAPARKMNRMSDPCHTWNAIYNAQSNKCHCPNSPNTAPASKNESHDWSLSHMKRYLQCAEQQVSLSKLTKYCACHAKWPSWSILFTHETLFTMRGVTSVIVQTHQILRLPRKITLMINPLHTWNAIYNARSNKCHCPNSPNTAPATQNDPHDQSSSHMKRYLQCAE